MTGSQQTRNLLLGIQTDSSPSNSYSSPQIVPFLVSMLQDPDKINQTLTEMAPPDNSHFVAYLEINSTTSELGLQASACNNPNDADHLYDISFVGSILHYSLAGFSYFEDLSTQWIIVDCAFDGRVSADTSTFKVFLIDHTMTNFTTFFIQTLNIVLPKEHRTTTGGAAIFTTTPLSSMAITDDLSSVVSFHVAKYEAAISITFPYDWAPFVPVQLDSDVPPSGRWQARVLATGESVAFMGTEGIYRKSPDIQANYDNYYWELPHDPIEYAKVIQYVNSHFFKDSWGWFRCLIGMGISFNIGLNTVVSIFVMVNLWRHDSIIWIPDIYPAIQRRATARAILLLFDGLWGSWWYAYESSLNQGNYRTGLVGTLYLEDMTRDDGLMVCLGMTYVCASLTGIRIQLIAVVIAYASSFAYRLDLVERLGLYVEDTHAFLTVDFNENLIPGTGGMDLWTIHENTETNFKLILTECSWLILAVSISLALCLLAASSPLHRRHRIWPTTPSQRVESITLITRRRTMKRRPNHWTLRSTLYNQLSLHDMDFTQFERSVGKIVGEQVGFVAPDEDYIMRGTTRYVSPSGVWLLGFVTVNDEYLVGINQYLFLVVNVLFEKRFFRIHAFRLDRDVASTKKQLLLPHHLTRWTVWNVSLKPLR
ncbi:unnamed protein product [Aphanomyces euteiches]